MGPFATAHQRKQRQRRIEKFRRHIERDNGADWRAHIKEQVN